MINWNMKNKIEKILILCGGMVLGLMMVVMVNAALLHPQKPAGLLAPINLNQLIMTVASPFTVSGNSPSIITGDGTTSTIGSSLMVNDFLQVSSPSSTAVIGKTSGTGYLPGCLVLGDSGSATSSPVYITATGGTVSATTTKPAICH